MSQITCLRCKYQIDASLDECPSCGDRITSFQRTYSTRLIDSKYQILDRLGVGGMGEIFKVRHIHLNELRVIKIMRPNVAADDQGLQRFLQEARTSTMIKHRNLAMLYDFAQLEDGSYYMVWEFIDGTNIQKWISQNGPVPPRLTVEVAIQALHGLDHLHSMGLIHRDVSPENIMLSQDHHGKLLAKVIDFGIAKSLAEGESGQGLTQTGMFLGKLKYASPEQAGFLKDGETLDPRSDLYSFGIVLYEMLAGRAPFQATNPHGYILKHVTERPPAISELNPEVRTPPQLESIIFRSLEKSRDNRYASAADFAAALEAIRASIAPDQKYGLGERMVTLSGAKTLADLPKYSPTSSGSAQTQQTMAGGTRSSADEATVMERNLTGGQRPGSDEATVMEPMGGAAGVATALEPKATWSGAGAEATLLERQTAPPRKNTSMLAAVAAFILIALAAGAFFLLRDKDSPVDPVTTPVVTTTTPGTTATTIDAPASRNQGVLLLSATPWGDIERIVETSSQRTVTLSDDDRSTPARLELDPGRYAITLKGPSKSETFNVDIEAGKTERKTVAIGTVNFDELAREVNQP